MQGSGQEEVDTFMKLKKKKKCMKLKNKTTVAKK